MIKRSCGQSGPELSVIGAGCWSYGGGEYWGRQEQRDVDNVVRLAVDLGVNYFDTAEAYNDGHSETSLGMAMKGLPRENILIGTKVSPCHTAPRTLYEHCEASLRRLGTDYVDIYMVHWPIQPYAIRHFTADETLIHNPPDVAAAFATLEQLRQQGKIRYIGVSNFGINRLQEVLSFGIDIVVNELPYSLLTRAIETEVLPYCRNTGVGVIGYMTLLQGLLAGIYPSMGDVPDWQRRTRHFSSKGNALVRHGEEGAEEETSHALDGIRAIAQDYGRNMPEIALQWAIANEGITCALVGARNVAELEANVLAAAQPLPEEARTELNSVTQLLWDKLGPSFDYYENSAFDRTR
jgi:aryl-alcohol dehydrogenase-like predicted oxidoreductase